MNANDVGSLVLKNMGMMCFQHNWCFIYVFFTCFYHSAPLPTPGDMQTLDDMGE